jgi:hypothetical protein
MVLSQASLVWILVHMGMGVALLLHRTILVFRTLWWAARYNGLAENGYVQLSPRPPPRAASRVEYQLFYLFLLGVLLNLDNTARVYPAAFTLAIVIAVALLAISFDAFALVRHRLPPAALDTMKYSLEAKEHVIFFTICYLAVLLEVLRWWTTLSFNVNAY